MGLDLAQVPYTKTALTALDKGAQMVKADLANNPQQKRLWGPASQLGRAEWSFSPTAKGDVKDWGSGRGVTEQSGG